MDDIVLNKAATIERCLARVRDEHAGDDRNVTDNQTRQDAIVLNIQRACEAAIDLAMHVVRRERLGIPQDTRDAFVILQQAGVIDDALRDRLSAMVGFRNVAVHDYQALNLDIVKAVIAKDSNDIKLFAERMIRRYA
jgi:uncharacterized protein YutE (UPF0331/DUF86 family)